MPVKPKVFIASSSEGLEIANALHANLQPYAEVTVWNQAFFQLSSNPLPSLIASLPNFDFGAFVFAPDDLVTIRGQSQQAVRDNVVFELGLFAGHLGQDRCFIVAPIETGDLRVPTDLLGIEPARYETSRSDNNLVAATGPAARAMRAHMESRGARLGTGQTEGGEPPKPAIPETPEATNEPKVEEPTTPVAAPIAEPAKPVEQWVVAFLERRFLDAAELLQELIANSKEQDQREAMALWRARALFESSTPSGEAAYLELAEDSATSSPRTELVYGLLRAGFDARALQIAEETHSLFPDDPAATVAKAAALVAVRRDDTAIALLEGFIADHSADGKDAFLELVRIYSGNSQHAEALVTLANALRLFPMAPELLEAKAKLLFEQKEYARTVRVYRQLVRISPDNSSYLTLMANALLELEAYDLAMQAYRLADRLAESKQAWIVANIGNLNNRRGFFTLGIEALEQALTLDPRSDYAQERLLQARRNHDAEARRLEAALAEAPEEEPAE